MNTRRATPKVDPDATRQRPERLGLLPAAEFERRDERRLATAAPVDIRDRPLPLARGHGSRPVPGALFARIALFTLTRWLTLCSRFYHRYCVPPN